MRLFLADKKEKEKQLMHLGNYREKRRKRHSFSYFVFVGHLDNSFQ